MIFLPRLWFIDEINFSKRFSHAQNFNGIQKTQKNLQLILFSGLPRNDELKAIMEFSLGIAAPSFLKLLLCSLNYRATRIA